MPLHAPILDTHFHHKHNGDNSMRKLKQDTVNQGVAGSSPASGAMFHKGLRAFSLRRSVQYLAICPIFGLLATPASANHALYTYGNPNTIQFCEVMQIDLSPDVLAPRNFVAYQDCGQAYPDPGQFHRHPYSRIEVILPDSRRFCSFVHHERFSSGDTTTVIDCRPMIDRR